MKKIIFYVPIFPEISETFIQREISALVKFNQIDIVVLALEKGSGQFDPILTPHVKYIKLGVRDVVLGFINTLANPMRILTSLTVVMRNENRNIFSNLYLWAKAFGLCSIFKRYNPDHVHVQFLSDSSTNVLLINELTEIPFSISAHARDVFGHSKNPELNCELLKDKLEKAEFIVLCNKKAYDNVIERAGTYKNKVFLNYHGIDLDAFSNIKSVSKQHDKPFIFALGRFVEKKGYKYLIQAAKILKDQNLGFKLIIAGSGDLKDEYVKLVSELDMNDIVYFYGDNTGVKNSDALSYIANCDVFVISGIDLDDGDADGIPNTLIEAGAFYKPVVTTNSGSLLEIVKNFDSAIVVDQKNPQELADGIISVITDSDLGYKLGQNLHKIVVERFDINKNVQFLNQKLK